MPRTEGARRLLAKRRLLKRREAEQQARDAAKPKSKSKKAAQGE